MLDKTNREITRVDRQIRSVQEQLNSAKVLNEDLKEVSNVIENSLTNARDLATEEVNEFIRELTEFAFIHEIAVLSITPRALFNQNRIIEQQFTLELECTYVQLGQYLATIEKYDYIVKVNTLEVRPQAERFREIRGERHVLYRVTLDLSIFKIIREA
jgi:Tfp pilus assembly protein PilO